MDYKKKIAELIKEHVDLDLDKIEGLIEVPPRPEMGDYAFPCFQLAKVMRKAPNMISGELAENINKDGFEKVEQLGPYVNFFVDKGVFSKNTIEKVLEEGDNYGASNIGEGKNVCVEYSSPNIAKPFHVDEEALEADPIKELLRIYVKFHDEAEKDPSLEDEGRAYFKALENGDPEAEALWKRFRDLSLKEFERVYDILGVNFDSYNGEAFYNDKMEVVVNELKEKKLLVESNGAQVVMLEDYNMPPCIVLKADGASIYATRDLAAAMYRKKTYDFYKSIYVVGTPQALHFKQVFKVLELAGHEWANDCVHVGFGLVKFADRKLSTRKGEVVLLDDLIRESVEKTLEVINEKNPELENKEEVAKKIGVGAVIFTYLKNSREKDIVFDWKEILSFDGETGPYVQYAYARAKSILRRAEGISKEVEYSKLSSKEEFELVKTLDNFKNQILLALDKLEPSIVTRYTIEVAKAFNKFYNAHSILNLEDEVLKATRLKLVEASAQVIKNGLDLLGIDVVEKM